MTWIFGQGNISAPLTTPIPTMFRPTISPTLRLPLRPSLRPQKCHTPTPLIQITDENLKDGDIFGDGVSVFTNRAIVGDPNYNNVKGKACLYKRVLGAWDDCQKIQASDESDGGFFCGSVSINEKTVTVRAPYKDNGNGPYIGAVYTFRLQGKTWTDDKN